MAQRWRSERASRMHYVRDERQCLIWGRPPIGRLSCGLDTTARTAQRARSSIRLHVRPSTSGAASFSHWRRRGATSCSSGAAWQVPSALSPRDRVSAGRLRHQPPAASPGRRTAGCTGSAHSAAHSKVLRQPTRGARQRSSSTTAAAHTAACSRIRRQWQRWHRYQQKAESGRPTVKQQQRQ